MQEVNRLIREAANHNGVSDSSERESNGDSEEGEEEEEPWDGIGDRDPSSLVDHEDEYMDGDRFTTVTVEAVDVSKDGLQRSGHHEEENENATSGKDGLNGEAQKDLEPHAREGFEKRKRVWTKKPPNGPKKRKKKFKYESKAERKVTRYKERLGNRAKARARKG